MTRRFLVLLACAVLAPGCTTFGGLQRSWRDPGEQLEAFPEKVWEQYDCGEQELPFFKIEKSQLVPKRLQAGEDFNHRWVYALCPDRPTAVIAGTLDTTILFRGEPIVRQLDESFEFKPGRWTVDAFVTIPEQAEPGIYSLVLAFAGTGMDFTERFTFAVEPPEE
ncbi:MAG: hypothetical protein QNK03_03625 [Myxococcota bacterium]|nr:hypothetical protein [Myxococcota bacterium]